MMTEASTQTRHAPHPSAGNGTPTIAEWLGDDPFPWPGIDDPAEGERFAACYCVEAKQLLLTKDEKPYLRLKLANASGSIEGRIWDDAERIAARIDEGGYVGVRATIQSFRNQRQLRIDEIRAVRVAPDELELFLPAGDLDLPALDAALDELIDSVTDASLRHLLLELVGRETETGRAFRRAPAAKRNHHAYIGGLLEHTVSITRLADDLARHYGPIVDRDLLITGAILHDIGKIEEIAVTGGFPYTDAGKLLGHILLGLEIVRDAARRIEDLDDRRLLLVLHLIASHQGKYEWQSPRIPHTLEALILHFVDDLDAKVNQAAALVRSVESGWTPYDGNFGREFLRHSDLAGELPTISESITAPRANSERLDPVRLDAERVDAERIEAERGEHDQEEEDPFADQVSIFDLL